MNGSNTELCLLWKMEWKIKAGELQELHSFSCPCAFEKGCFVFQNSQLQVIGLVLRLVLCLASVVFRT
jgi:hypothetical protein